MQLLPLDLASFLSKYLYLIITFVMIQGSLTFVLLFLFIDKITSSRKIKTQELLAKQDAYEESLRILNDSKAQSSKLILAAQEQSTKIIQETNFLNESFKQKFAEELKSLVDRQEDVFKNVAGELSKQYQQAFEQEKITTLSELTKVSDTLRSDMLTKVDEFKSVLEKNTVEAENELRGKVRQDYEYLSQRMKEYETAKLQKIDEKIFLILTQVTKDILGSALTINEQEELVFKVLNDAKVRQGI